ncbi:MAG: VCBS repeat-containing protein, partial [Flavobacteriales bacterium]|nr:VCBS repeat-containing protein [Flavobacteriales bacterium]
MKSFAFISIGIALPFLLAGGAQAQFGAPVAILNGLNRPTVHPPIDMDNDGDLDIVLQNDTGHVAFWLENVDGLGTFQPVDTFGILLETNALITIGDLFLDGYPDMVINMFGSLQYRRNNGNGVWSAPGLIETGITAYSIRIAEMTGDALPDIVVALDYPSDIRWYHNTGIPPFGVSDSLIITGGPPASDLEIVDLNGDGLRDIFRMNWNGYGVVALGVDPQGTQWNIQQVNQGGTFYTENVDVLDMDGDGDLDIAAHSWGGVRWLQNNGNGNFPDFTARTVPASSFADAVAYGQLGCGNGMEAVWTTPTPETFKWSSYTNDLDDFAPPQDLPQLAPYHGDELLVADLDGDGREDLLVLEADSLFWIPSGLGSAAALLPVPVFDTLCGPTVPLPLPVGTTWWFDGMAVDTLPAGSIVDRTDTLIHVRTDSTGCLVSGYTPITHMSYPALYSPIFNSICSNQPAVQLSASPTGGTWTGTTLPNGLFDPAAMGPGTYLITYTYFDPTGNLCQNGGPITVPFEASGGWVPAGPFCSNDTVQELQGYVDFYGGYFQGPVTPVDLSGNPIIGAFDPAQGPGSYEVFLIANPGPGECPDVDTLTIVVLEPPLVTAPADTTLCLNPDIQELQGGAPAGGTWSGPGIAPDGTLVTDVLGLGMHPAHYSYTNSDGCTDSALVMVTVTICTGEASIGRPNVPDAWWDAGTQSVGLLSASWPSGTWQLF